MAHLNIPSTPQAAIFSPSVARAAASTAKDWAYVDDWLRAKYAPLRKRPPPFERNADTLRTLLALVAANEAADEEREQLARIEEAALAEVRAAEEEAEARRRKRDEDAEPDQPVDGALLASDLLHAIDDALSRDGRTALDAMSDVAVELGIAPQAQTPSSASASAPASSATVTIATANSAATLTPESLSRRFVELQGSAYEIDQAAHRVDMLRRYLDAESSRTAALLSSLRALDVNSSQPPPPPSHPPQPAAAAPPSSTDLARQNLDTQRRIRAASARLPDLRQQVAALSRSAAAAAPSLTVDDVRRDEEAYLELLGRKRDLDARVRAFAGLPPDVGAARAELEALRAELRRATDRRDANFESLVERESPVKTRKR